MTITVKCYIEEYEDKRGQLSARLRQKGTGKKVNLGFSDAAAKQHFLHFLGAAKQNQVVMPDVFSKDGEDDCVEVTGDLDFEAPDEIRFVSDENLQYLFS